MGNPFCTALASAVRHSRIMVICSMPALKNPFENSEFAAELAGAGAGASSVAPGAWEAVAAARFRRPDGKPSSTPSSTRPYERIGVPTLVIEGGDDKLLPPGWAAQIAKQIEGGRSAVVGKAGHCPQIEQPLAVNDLLLDFLATV